jgi:hypothetical protein
MTLGGTVISLFVIKALGITFRGGRCPYSDKIYDKRCIGLQTFSFPAYSWEEFEEAAGGSSITRARGLLETLLEDSQKLFTRSLQSLCWGKMEFWGWLYRSS